MRKAYDSLKTKTKMEIDVSVEVTAKQVRLTMWMMICPHFMNLKRFSIQCRYDRNLLHFLIYGLHFFHVDFVSDSNQL